MLCYLLSQCSCRQKWQRESEATVVPLAPPTFHYNCYTQSIANVMSWKAVENTVVSPKNNPGIQWSQRLHFEQSDCLLKKLNLKTYCVVGFFWILVSWRWICPQIQSCLRVLWWRGGRWPHCRKSEAALSKYAPCRVGEEATDGLLSKQARLMFFVERYSFIGPEPALSEDRKLISV